VVEGVQKIGGITPYGMGAVVLGLVVCVVIGLAMREKAQAPATEGRAAPGDIATA